MGKKHLIAAEAEGDQRSLWGEAWRRFKKNRLAMIGMYFILALVIIAIATIIIDAVTGKSIYLNYVVKQDLRGRLQGPSLAHPFGLDEFGRDMLLRMLWAVRYSLFMGTVAIIISSGDPVHAFGYRHCGGPGDQHHQCADCHCHLLCAHLCQNGPGIGAYGEGPAVY